MQAGPAERMLDRVGHTFAAFVVDRRLTGIFVRFSQGLGVQVLTDIGRDVADRRSLFRSDQFGLEARRYVVAKLGAIVANGELLQDADNVVTVIWTAKTIMCQWTVPS